MVKKVLCFGMVALFLVCTSAFAGGSGNCVLPIKTTTDDRGIGAAFEYNYISKRLMDLNDTWGPKDSKIQDVSQVYGKILYGLSDSQNLYVNIGAAHYDLEFEDEEKTASVKMLNGPYAGVGLNGLFPMMEVWELDIGVGYDVQANSFFNGVKEAERAGKTSTDEDGWCYAVDGQESIYLTFKYDNDYLKTLIVPYVGAYHSWIVVGTLDNISYKTSDGEFGENITALFDVLSFGVVLGVDVDVAKFISFNVEGRFIGETAVTTGATIKF